jgi:hypothetical protein
VDAIIWGMNRPRIYSLGAFKIQDHNRQGEIYLPLGFGTDFDLNPDYATDIYCGLKNHAATLVSLF